MFFRDKRTLKICRIYTMLKTHARQKHLSFHTPGHKIGKWDITELSFSDNLSSPRGCIAQAEKEVAQILGAYKSFLLTDGSTCGVLSMLHAAKTLGVKSVAFPETAHKSVWNGCALLGLTPFPFSVEHEGGIPKPTVLKNVENVLLAADAILLTSPDYYGNIPDLFSFRKFCDDTKKLLLIDGAHGGHLHFDKAIYAGAFADLWVDGVHKSLPALTQGAVVSAKDEKGAAALQKGVDIFRSTSPSYPILASVEYAVKAPQGKTALYARALAEKYPQRMVLQKDFTKLCVRFGLHAFSAEKDLEKQGVYPEFCDGNILMFYLSCKTKKRALVRLENALLKLFKKYPLESVEQIHAPVVLPKTTQTEWVNISDCEGKISAQNFGLFPPCVPLVKRGEQITKESLALLQKADNVFGVYEEKLLIFKGEEV